MNATDDDDAVETIVHTTKPAPIKRFLAKPPRGADTLRLLAAADGGSNVQLGSWHVDVSTPSLALEIVQIMEEHCIELEAPITAVLQWLSKEGAPVGGTKALSARLHRAPPTDFGATPEDLTGDSRSMAVQAQKHLEVMQRMMLNSINATLHQSRQLAEQAMELANTHATARNDAEERADALKQELASVQGELDRVMVQDESADPADEKTSAAQNQVMKMLESPVVQQHLMKLLFGGGSSPPTAPPAS